jgi:hypothetical protein
MGLVTIILNDNIDRDFRETAAKVHGKDTRGKYSMYGTKAILLYNYIHQRAIEAGIPPEDVEDIIYQSVDECIDRILLTLSR